MAGRKANAGINKMLGSELQDLINFAEQGYVVTKREAYRVRGRYDDLGPASVVPRICKNYYDNYECSHGRHCSHIHAKEEKDLRDEEIFSRFID